MNVAQLREQIPVCHRTTYVNTGWSGPSPISVVWAIKERLEYEMDQGPTTPEVHESGREIQKKTREEVARLLNASVEEICLTKNTTEGLNIVINGLSWHRGDEIITCDLEHSSVLIPCFFQQQRHGVVVKVLPLAPDEAWDSILNKIEAALTERTRLIFLSHVQYSCGLRMPIKEIRKMTKDRGILLLLDGAQAAGHISLDMRALDCDFYSIPGQKWLLGPEGTGALYVRKELIPEVEPMYVASRAVLPADEFDQFEQNSSSMDKFLLTSTSAALQTGMLETIRFIQEIGVGEIEQRNLGLATSLKQALQEIPRVKVLTSLESQNASGLVSFVINGVDAKDAVSSFWDRHGIVARQVSFPSCVRVSMHFFNTEEEVSKIVKAVQELV